jgi:YHS domain-containing protein
VRPLPDLLPDNLLNGVDWTGAADACHTGDDAISKEDIMAGPIVLARYLVIAVAMTMIAPGVAGARSPDIYTGILSATAVGGYDPVAYFVEGKPVAGKRGITYSWKGATWRFANEKNRDLFKEKPEAYAPQFGGYCAWAVSQGYTAKGDPQHWKIVGGKLYLNYDGRVQKTWEKDIPGNIAKGDRNWPKVLDK